MWHADRAEEEEEDGEEEERWQRQCASPGPKARSSQG